VDSFSLRSLFPSHFAPLRGVFAVSIAFFLYSSDMEFVRQIVNGNALKPVITLPPSFHNVQVEVIVLPVENRKSGPDISTKPVRHSAFGRLKAHANPSLISEEKGAWEKAAAIKL
jgi:hypothetical protein